MVKLITWKMDRSKATADPEERMKLTMTMCEKVKEGIESGRMKIWGVNPGGNHGFAVSGADDTEIFAMVAQYIPHVKFKVESMLSIDEVIAAFKAPQEKA